MRACGAATAVVMLLAAACGCQQAPPSAPTTVVVNVQNIQGLPQATPQPTPAGLAGVIVLVRTGFFGGSCPDGGEVRNGQPLRVGCTGFATATPVGAAGEKLPPEAHGATCAWSTSRSDVVELRQPGDNPFNVDVVALRPGVARVTAVVQGITGGFDVEVR